MKRIVFTVVTYGSDGRGKQSEVFATLSELEQIEWYNNNLNKNYYSLSEKIIDTDTAVKEAKGKLNAIDKLMLGVEQPHN